MALIISLETYRQTFSCWIFSLNPQFSEPLPSLNPELKVLFCSSLPKVTNLEEIHQLAKGMCL
jgi:hypothetical protein